MSFRASTGWTGIVGANGSGKSTLLKLASGLLMPDTGTISLCPEVLYLAQGVEDAPPRFEEFLESHEAQACRLRGQFNIQEDWHFRWHTLSPGERKCAQVAHALWIDPGVMALDEPTNHLDFEVSKVLSQALSRFQGIGLLVSHDRALLNQLCAQCLFLDSEHSRIRPGNYDSGRQQEASEYESRVSERSRIKDELGRLAAETERRHQEVQGSAARLSKRNIGRYDSDGRNRINAARVSGKDKHAGSRYAHHRRRVLEAQSKLDAYKVTSNEIGNIEFAAASANSRNYLDIREGRLLLANTKELIFPSISVRHGDRIGIRGPNGIGKTSFLSFLRTQLRVRPEEVFYLGQELDQQERSIVLQKLTALDCDQQGKLFALLARLGSEPKRVLAGLHSSPGEMKKLLLAHAILAKSKVMIIDEPTNHLDLPSMEKVESALSEFPGALLVVSHDQTFINKLTTSQWIFGSVSDKEVELRRS